MISDMDDEFPNVNICLCFPCIISALGGYVEATQEDQHYPILEAKGYSELEQKAIAEEWYWVAVERDAAIQDWLNGELAPADRDNCCWWRTPPNPPMPPQPISNGLSNGNPPDAASPSEASSVAGSAS